MKKKDGHPERHRLTDTHRQGGRQSDKDTDSHKQTDRQAETQTDRQAGRHKGRPWGGRGSGVRTTTLRR